MSIVASLLAEIESFCRERGITESTFSRRAVSDGKFVARLRAGKGITVATVDRVRDYIAAERAAAPPATEGQEGASPADRRRSTTFPEAA